MALRMQWIWVVLGLWLGAALPLRAADPQLELVVQTGHPLRVTAAAFSPDGRYILTGSVDKTAILWETATGQKLRTFAGHLDYVNAVAFSPNPCNRRSGLFLFTARSTSSILKALPLRLHSEPTPTYMPCSSLPPYISICLAYSHGE